MTLSGKVGANTTPKLSGIFATKAGVPSLRGAATFSAGKDKRNTVRNAVPPIAPAIRVMRL